ncbi:MAG: lipase maturation factor family protein [Planctomycetota bacterium]|nr:lipase maturation factor family protein [Planctomycetota bacterium]
MPESTARLSGIYSFLARLLWGKDLRESSFLLSRWLFLRLLGLIHLIAFASYWSQMEGLVGSHGISPAVEFLESLKRVLGDRCYSVAPTICWLGASDGILHVLCGVGVMLSVLLVGGVAPVPVLFVLWWLYLSLVVVGQQFFNFQWDVLLLETTFLALFLAPLAWLPDLRKERSPSKLALGLQFALLFKLMFLSGVTKLLSGDSTWLRLTALPIHYETQPLPTVLGWYTFHLPDWFHRFSVLGMFVIEIPVAFLIFAPRRLRHLGALSLMLFQLLIALTGNYTFFNLLTVVLCVLLFDDLFLLQLVPGRWRGRVEPPARSPPALSRPWWLRTAIAAPMVLILMVSTYTLLAEVSRTYRNALGRQPPPEFSWPVGATLEMVGRLVDTVEDENRGGLAGFRHVRTINGYGLFRSMTVLRPELIFEGSRDGVEWKEYEFRWKPVALDRAPGFVAPHQPRLDWQMWFAALNVPGNLPWLQRLAQHLLRGTPEVLALLGENPFPDAPPSHVRLVYYKYRFTSLEVKRETGAWWTREKLGVVARFSPRR